MSRTISIHRRIHMGKKISKRRQEMGEDAWGEYQKERRRKKASTYWNSSVGKVIRSRQKKKLLLVEYKGGVCERCQFKSDIMNVYDFHHVNPEEKDFNISHENASLERCKKKIDKCKI